MSQAQSTQQQRSIVVGLSGGVDSSVAALLLQQQGYAVEAMFMKNWDEDDNETCSATQDLEDAAAVAKSLCIELHTRNFSTEYWNNVFQYFLREHKLGRTPNPDVLCNTEIKFKTFLQHAIQLGADRIATGHYARCHYEGGYFRLLKAIDQNKDQSYFLHALNQSQLSKALFPLGDYHKPQIRELAARAGFNNASKKDSTGICFIGERNFKHFLSRYLPAQPGDILTPDGIHMGQHDGLMYYTYGQRQGLGIGGVKGANQDPWYVVDKDLNNNTLIVAQGHDHPLLFSNSLLTEKIHWIAESPSAYPFICSAKTRYRQSDQVCQIEILDDGRYLVSFEQAQRAITPGQSVVFYRDEECLGGGIITLRN